MKKSVLNIGVALGKAEQKEINGGNNPGCNGIFGCKDDPVCLYAGQSCGINQYCCEDPSLGAPLVCLTFEECLAGPGV